MKCTSSFVFFGGQICTALIENLAIQADVVLVLAQNAFFDERRSNLLLRAIHWGDIFRLVPPDQINPSILLYLLFNHG